MEKCKEEFEATSRNIMDEMERFDIMKLEDFKCQVIQYFDSLRDHQLQVCIGFDQYYIIILKLLPLMSGCSVMGSLSLRP